MSNLTHETHTGQSFGNATLLADPSLCTLSTCDLSLASFSYIPNLAGNTIFTVIFALLFVSQAYLGITRKSWGFMICLLFGLLLEVIGYIGRILLHNSPFIEDNFLIYLICLTIAPAFMSAAIYLCLGRIVVLYGESLSRFRPQTYTYIFCGCDIISLILQATGGGIAASADTGSGGVDTGKSIMLAGLGFQVFSLALFAGFSGEFALRVWNGRGLWNSRYTRVVDSKLFKCSLAGLATATLTIFIRSLYRCIELSGGFDSNLFRDDEVSFMILEGVMIIIACVSLTALHPAVCFQGCWHETAFPLFGGRRSASQSKFIVSDEEGLQEEVEMGNRGK
ncbi:RTA1 like protein-domain-containing protein [Amylocarpus encephaloides]|uniref:RTA1 like protein-domain-containing protein n=1 Tax=Amylocarpus encephaloides TaxID=45428 RepID=A0A9P8C3R1_9HELO|nr:RTA1 like protein-domain-containing protein [Amylocarpus encephaloides]